jgi:D-beta-D-heptose 7-phosphate kinase/D-beta-D-heptose 1-phosphate adenosyltransferase
MVLRWGGVTAPEPKTAPSGFAAKSAVSMTKSPSDPLSSFDGQSVLVVGDVMLDCYVRGSVSRVSPEAPVPVVSIEQEWSRPGGAGHVAASLAGLGCQVTVVGAVGADPAADDLRKALSTAGVSAPELVNVPESRTVTKTRILANGFHQLVRFDRDPQQDHWERSADRLLAAALPRVAESSAVVLADYNKGTLSARVITALVAEARKHRRPVIIDPKKRDFAIYRDASVLTPNTLEVETATGRSLRSDAEFGQAASELRARLGLGAMLITRGPHGMTGADDSGVFHLAARVREVADVTGAGDTVVAVLAAAMAGGATFRDACALASLAAGIAVSQPGAYVVRREELQAAAGMGSHKIVSRETVRQHAKARRERGQRVVFTNGCFDILHAGHLQSLQQARNLGDALVVGVNTDASVRAIKGPERPILSQEHRAGLLAGLACVDYVVLFDDATPEQLIHAVEPDILVKGGDYDPKTIAGADFVRSRGGQVVTLPLLEGFSTTRILERVKTSGDSPGAPPAARSL